MGRPPAHVVSDESDEVWLQDSFTAALLRSGPADVCPVGLCPSIIRFEFSKDKPKPLDLKTK